MENQSQARVSALSAQPAFGRTYCQYILPHSDLRAAAGRAAAAATAQKSVARFSLLLRTLLSADSITKISATGMKNNPRYLVPAAVPAKNAFHAETNCRRELTGCFSLAAPRIAKSDS